MMGPTELCIMDKSGNPMYLTIKYRRSGKTFYLRVPMHFSAYFSRSPIFIKHNFGKFNPRSMILYLLKS